MQLEKIKVQIQLTPYKKIMFHSLRYPSNKVYGIIVGSSSNQITDAYPLFHTPLVNPSLTIAINLVQSNLPQGISIQGFYQFIQNGQPLINKIFDNNSLIKKLHLLRVWHNGQSNLQCGITNAQVQTPSFDQILKDLKQGSHRLIVDMDSHFQDINLDFRNTYVK